MYDEGEGVKKDPSEAFKWYYKAAMNGHATAMYNLAVAYRDGDGVKQDYDEALKWYRKAALNGNADAQEVLKQIGEKW